MANTIPDWLKPGAEVVEGPAPFYRVWGKVRKVGKVRKNGLFSLEGDDKSLWSAFPNGATPTKGNYGAKSLHPYVGEHKAKAEHSWKVEAARERLRAYAEKLNRAISRRDEDVILAEVAKLPPEDVNND